ncbi:hypothetical protein [Streptomyces sp. NPDC007088]|uniref:hypothetical protein n=1 Tax=Streptomyces sp. NPDC007088 TaxID=3364773 RepID=UPI0036C55573
MTATDPTTARRPAAAATPEALPPGPPVDVWTEAGTEAGSEAGRPAGPRAHRPPGFTPCAWSAGDCGTAHAARRRPARERGLGRHSVTFAGHGRRGLGEERSRLSARRQETD